VPRVCRVAPDVTAVERVFDYLVPDALAPLVRVGAIVRVPLHGRRVRGWVVADDVTPGTDERLLEVLAVASDGPSADVVALTDWIAWRWSGPRIAVLRSASAPNRVAPTPSSSLPPQLASQTRTTSGSGTQVRRIIRSAQSLQRRALMAKAGLRGRPVAALLLRLWVMPRGVD